MKFLIAGAGAIGAYIGAMLARGGQEVVLLARGRHCSAMRERGVRVRSASEEFVATPRVVDSLAEVGLCDVIFLGVKAHSLSDLAPRLRPLLGRETVVVSTQNGVPWWYFQNHGGNLEGLRLERLDPGGIITGAIESQKIVGSIVYFSTEIIEPGVVRHIEGNKIVLGELDGSRSERCRCIAQALIQAGLRCPLTTRIRHEIWVKLLGNVAFNPISALTGATLVEMARDTEVSVLARNIMLEAESVASKIGIDVPVTVEQRIAGAEKVGEHKTSMLQDLEADRPMELEAVVGAVLELGERLGLPMTHTHAVYACAKLMSRCRGKRAAAFAPG